MLYKGYEIVVGLEIHIELKTNSKLFCSCQNKFGAPANTLTCPVCLGMGGALPLLNRKAVELGLRAAFALGAHIAPLTGFDRKHYFYPDLPKGYQITQLRHPIAKNGFIDIGAKKIGITEMHLEEDAGKMLHSSTSECSRIDYNRAGIPLLEIVTEPDIRTPREATASLEILREILLFADISDCRMQEGSMRVDVNLSVRPAGEKSFGQRTEMKNLNSVGAVSRAIQSEAKRQVEVILSGGNVHFQTRRWDDEKGESFPLRIGEASKDYRPLPEFDIADFEIPASLIQQASILPEFAEQKRRRYHSQYGISQELSAILTICPQISNLFEETAQLCGHVLESANCISGEVMHLLTESRTSPEDITLQPQKLSTLIGMTVENKITRTVAKTLLSHMFYENVEPYQYAQSHHLFSIEDSGLIRTALLSVIEANPKAVDEYRMGKEKVLGFLTGQAMKALEGRADAIELTRLLAEMLS